jgi:hypothetical protein
MRAELERCLMARNAANVLVNLAVDVQLGTSVKLNDDSMVNGIVKNAAMSLKSGSTELQRSILQKAMDIAMNGAI